jgi:hypothetical protein
VRAAYYLTSVASLLPPEPGKNLCRYHFVRAEICTGDTGSGFFRQFAGSLHAVLSDPTHRHVRNEDDLICILLTGCRINARGYFFPVAEICAEAYRAMLPSDSGSGMAGSISRSDYRGSAVFHTRSPVLTSMSLPN